MTAPPVLPLAPPAFRLPLFDMEGRSLGGARSDGMLAGAIITSENPQLEAFLARPSAGPPASFRLTVNREQRGFSFNCTVNVSVHDSATQRRLFRLAVPMGAQLTALGGWDCKGSVTVTYPAALPASRQVYLVLDDGDGHAIGRSGPVRLAELAQAGTTSRDVQDDRTVTERIGDAASGAGRWTGETFNKALWAGGIAGGIVLLMLSRR